MAGNQSSQKTLQVLLGWGEKTSLTRAGSWGKGREEHAAAGIARCSRATASTMPAPAREGGCAAAGRRQLVGRGGLGKWEPVTPACVFIQGNLWPESGCRGMFSAWVALLLYSLVRGALLGCRRAAPFSSRMRWRGQGSAWRGEMGFEGNLSVCCERGDVFFSS